jgi:hypothetical protein
MLQPQNALTGTDLLPTLDLQDENGENALKADAPTAAVEEILMPFADDGDQALGVGRFFGMLP